MQSRSVVLEGQALHRGTPARVTLVAAPGPLCIVQRGAAARVRDLVVTRTDRGVTLASIGAGDPASIDRRGDGVLALDLVEHLFAAIGGLGIREGLSIVTDDDELPLLDGGARRYAEALAALDLPRAAPALIVAREATLTHGASRYRFVPGDALALAVEVRFPEPVGEERAAWAGDAADFVARIAPARTFGWASDYDALRAAGRAGGVDLRSVMVFDGAGVLPGCAPAAPAEVARHKLLDLLGDLAIHGGPPRGTVDAHRPGHGATHAIVREAIATGVIARHPSTRGEGA